MKNKFILLFFIFSISSLYAQEEIDFGDVPIELLKQTHYPSDSSAHAAIIYNSGHSRITMSRSTGELSLIFKKVIRIKIYDEKGFDQSNFQIELYSANSSRENISGLKAYTHNLKDGKVVRTKFDKDNIYVENFSKNIKLKKFALQNVVKGSVIELRYTLTSPFYTSIPSWDFQDQIPVKYSSYKIQSPEWFRFKSHHKGFHPLANYSTDMKSESWGNESVNIDVQLMEAKNLPAFPDEKFIPNINSYLSGVNFQLQSITIPGYVYQDYASTWRSVVNAYHDHEDGSEMLDLDSRSEKTIESLALEGKSDLEKAKIIYNYVQNTYNWNESYRFLATKSARALDKDLEGASSDINLQLIKLLRQAGVAAYPVLLSTRDNGIIIKYLPNTRKLNSVIARIEINKKEILLDATDKHVPFGVLPVNDLNDVGMIVRGGDQFWVNLNGKKSVNMKSYNCEIDENLDLIGVYQERKTGYDAISFNKGYDSTNTSKYITEYENEINEATVENFTVGSKKGVSNIKFNFDVEEFIEEESLISFNPLMSEATVNPFKLEKREFPIDFGYTSKSSLMIKYKIPKGYIVDKIPESTNFKLPEGKCAYTYHAAVKNNVLSIIITRQINRQRFSPTDYEILKAYFEIIETKEKEHVYLKKASEVNEL